MIVDAWVERVVTNFKALESTTNPPEELAATDDHGHRLSIYFGRRHELLSSKFSLQAAFLSSPLSYDGFGAAAGRVDLDEQTINQIACPREALIQVHSGSVRRPHERLLCYPASSRRPKTRVCAIQYATAIETTLHSDDGRNK